MVVFLSFLPDMQRQAHVKSFLQMFEFGTDDMDNILAAVGISSDDNNDDDDKSEGLLMYFFPHET